MPPSRESNDQSSSTKNPDHCCYSLSTAAVSLINAGGPRLKACENNSSANMPRQIGERPPTQRLRVRFQGSETLRHSLGRSLDAPKPSSQAKQHQDSRHEFSGPRASGRVGSSRVRAPSPFPKKSDTSWNGLVRNICSSDVLALFRSMFSHPPRKILGLKGGRPLRSYPSKTGCRIYYHAERMDERENEQGDEYIDGCDDDTVAAVVAATLDDSDNHDGYLYIYLSDHPAPHRHRRSYRVTYRVRRLSQHPNNRKNWPVNLDKRDLDSEAPEAQFDEQPKKGLFRKIMGFYRDLVSNSADLSWDREHHIGIA
ncbi:hypothetical protein F4779DRAFT_608058 [Xylariaceae sp. FL0662B]|nr:hypothetical protein F4779DRAFT_608058 [Xylariaceae sp. FL0662B]